MEVQKKQTKVNTLILNMPKIRYVKKRFSSENLDKIAKANSIIAEYQSQGLSLTLRQIFYQFVSRDFIPNTQKEYKNLGSILNDARLAGLVDWDAMEDRTRNLRGVGHWTNPESIIDSAAYSFRLDKWGDQHHRIEVWIEKDALVGVIEKVCADHDVPYFSCRGYTSQSELWAAARRLARYASAGQQPIIIHLGDHDPSGIDMTRDISDRMFMFEPNANIEVRRIALNMNQVQEFEPPPNPAKITDSRFEQYQQEHGDESWELDALEPQVIIDLITKNILEVREELAWNNAVDRENEHRSTLTKAAARWTDVVKFLNKPPRKKK